jgi:predicted DNA-binding transcriptional regulator AlpA
MEKQKLEDKKPKKYMTTREVAALFCVSIRTVGRWRVDTSSGMPRPKKFASGSSNRYLTSEIEAWENATGL